MADRDKTLTESGVENQSEGRFENVKGRVKDTFGSATGDRSLESEGKMDQMKGKMKDKLGGAQRELDKDVDPDRNI